MNILVIDVGTSSMRGILYSPNVEKLASHRVAYSVESSGICVEQSAVDWFNALTEICGKIAAGGFAVDALALTSQRSSLIPVDDLGRPLRKAIMWQDTRNTGIIEELKQHAESIAALTGARLNTVYSGSKMTWLRQNEPAIYSGAYKLCTIADYLTHLMTGEFVTDETYGSRSLLMGLRSRTWEPELLKLFEVDEDKLCKIIPPGSISGRVTRAFSQLTGIAEGIPLISAGGDQQCGALGQGVFDRECASITFGTSACILKAAEQVPDRSEGLLCGAHAVPGQFVLEGSMLTCGAAFDWARRTLFPNENFDSVNAAVRSSPPGANGVIAIPAFQGRGTPGWNSAVRGGFLNLNLNSTRQDMMRALLESIIYEMVNNLYAFAVLGEPVSGIRIGGGVTKNQEIARILSDASGLPVWCNVDQNEDTAFGAWMNAAVSLGLVTDYREAFAFAPCNLTVTEPDSRQFETYAEGRKRMNDACARLYSDVKR